MSLQANVFLSGVGHVLRLQNQPAIMHKWSGWYPCKGVAFAFLRSQEMWKQRRRTGRQASCAVGVTLCTVFAMDKSIELVPWISSPAFCAWGIVWLSAFKRLCLIYQCWVAANNVFSCSDIKHSPLSKSNSTFVPLWYGTPPLKVLLCIYSWPNCCTHNVSQSYPVQCAASIVLH